jgi:hypothetical protein
MGTPGTLWDTSTLQLLDAVDRRIGVFAQVFDPLRLDPRIVLGGLDQVHEADHVLLEALLTRKPSLGAEGGNRD